MMDDVRLVELETRSALQEHTLQELNLTVYRQQKQIDQLQALCESLARHVLELKETMADHGGGDEKPPHY